MALRKLVTFVSHGAIKDGRLVLNNEAYFRTIIRGYRDTKLVRIILEPARGTKTLAQLGYYHGVVLTEIARHTGSTVEELDDVFKAMFLSKSMKWRDGELVTIRSKAELTSDEMGEFIDQVLGEAAELGIEIPEPDKEWATHDQFPESRKGRRTTGV